MAIRLFKGLTAVYIYIYIYIYVCVCVCVCVYVVKRLKVNEVYEVHTRSLFLWVIHKVVSYRRSEAVCRSHLQERTDRLKMGPISCPETWVRSYRPVLRQIPKEYIDHLLRVENLKLHQIHKIHKNS